MTTPERVESDLGWALGQVTRTHIKHSEHVLAGLPGGPRGYLVLTAAREGTPTQLALARKLGVDRTVMTYLLDELVAAGLVERRPDPADRRARQIHLTPAGWGQLCEYARRLAEVEEHLLAPLAPAEQDQLRALLARLATAVPAEGNPCQVAEDIKARMGITEITRG
ncbi:MarR family winged helix-turn-helix transcriptional regulator [Pseudonocardia sp. WMMC193]|uniref:MarR family winged helix-turn-helix transcriptional regulator n=1 Tax=Pseudonocardia sp. WMMC193 TaxID=2911965 RepID=UPI001F2F4823|nr:MarR family winged helix-turn-helix transcriptional regulator [Pseudonocardia sp. WMMC193]MCF7552411.1 MarR family winged helix-turn-helix transcriptional regulator [Pseudonocardia sp. WMMC193]